MIYYVRRLDTGEIKIGHSGNVPQRMATLRSEAGPLELLATTPGGRAEEHALHQRFQWFNTRGEWFVSSTSLINHIRNIVDDGKQRCLSQTP